MREQRRKESLDGYLGTLQELCRTVSSCRDWPEIGLPFRAEPDEIGVRQLRCLENGREGSGTGLLGLEGRPGGVVDEAEAAAMRREPNIRVIDAQVQAEFGARGEHAIRLVGALGDQVLDEDAGVGIGRGKLSTQDRLRLAKSAALMPAISPWHAASS